MPPHHAHHGCLLYHLLAVVSARCAVGRLVSGTKSITIGTSSSAMIAPTKFESRNGYLEVIGMPKKGCQIAKCTIPSTLSWQDREAQERTNPCYGKYWDFTFSANACLRAMFTGERLIQKFPRLESYKSFIEMRRRSVAIRES